MIQPGQVRCVEEFKHLIVRDDDSPEAVPDQLDDLVEMFTCELMKNMGLPREFVGDQTPKGCLMVWWHERGLDRLG